MVLHASESGFWRYHVFLNGVRLERVIRADDQTGDVLVVPVDEAGAALTVTRSDPRPQVETLRGEVRIVCHTPAPPRAEYEDLTPEALPTLPGDAPCHHSSRAPVREAA